MGIHFACHVCAKQLNIKQDLAGKRGICPACSSKFRIPANDAVTSLPIDDSDARRSSHRQGQPVGSMATNQTLASKPAESPTKEATSHSPTKQALAKPAVEFDLLTDDPDATWYVRPPSGGQYGPANSDVLRSWIDEGRVASTSLLWRDGWPNWRSADEALPGLASKSLSNDNVNFGSASNSPMPLGSATPATAPPEAPSHSSSSRSVASVGIDKPSASETPSLAGKSDVGTQRRRRNGKRIFWIGALSAISIALIGVLVYLVAGN